MPLFQPTPTILAETMSRRVNAKVWLKLECLHEAGSFKIRGMGARCEELLREGARALVCSSGGNAGYAVAWAARALHVPATIIVPQPTAAEVRQRITALGAQVVVHGAAWDESHAYALQLCAQNGAGYVHPFDHPTVWQGNAGMIDEAAHQLEAAPDAVVVSVGGGGLFCGVMQGLERAGWHATRVLAVETHGAASLAAAVEAGRLVRLERITSLATTLGAKQVAAQALTYAQRPNVHCVTLSDAQAVEACIRFADEQRLLVEPACGAALAAVYAQHEKLADCRNVLVIVCGGIGVSLDKLARWREGVR